MTDIELGTLLANPARAGTCFVDDHERVAVMEAATARGFVVATVDLENTHDKPALLDALAAALDFPPTFGRNWDALADSLGDLSWLPAPGYILLLDHADGLREAAPQDFDTLLESLEDAARSHASDGVPFWAVLSLRAQRESSRRPA